MTQDQAFAFPDEIWPGLAKLVEECGKVMQVAGKLMMVHGNNQHWDGDIRARMLEELADLRAASVFLLAHNFSEWEQQEFMQRVGQKLTKFDEWSKEGQQQ
jgi:hypothetical protein